MKYLAAKYPNIELSGASDAINKYCIIDTKGPGGLFANFYRLIYGIYICIMEEITPIIQMNGSKYLYYQGEYGENIFYYYYKKRGGIKPAATKDTPIMIVICPDVFIRWCRISISEKKMANFIIDQFFQLRKSIDNIINTFVKVRFGPNRVLGFHYRGRDKVNESAIAPFEEYDKIIDDLLSKKICDLVFFCSDELDLREGLQNKYGDKLLLYDLEANYYFHRSSDENLKIGLHFNSPTPYLQGKDSLIECYLLSKCDMLLSSSNSSFSLFATFINPRIPHIILNA